MKPFFWKIANTLLEYSDRAERQARGLTADLVLETRNEGGGLSVFQRYATYLNNQELYEQTRSAMMEACIVNEAKPLSQAKVYEKVADDAHRELEKVRKNFEAQERDLGSFAIGAAIRAKKRAGITEV